MLYFLKFIGYVAVMLAIVPLAGLCVTGSWRAAWRYTLAWGRVMAITIAAAVMVSLVAWPFISILE